MISASILYNSVVLNFVLPCSSDNTLNAITLGIRFPSIHQERVKNSEAMLRMNEELTF